MSHRRIRIVFLIFLLAVTLFVAAYVSIRQGQLASVFKENFKTALSNATGAKIEIDSIRGNIFSRIIVRGLECDFGIYSITFEKARLEYSLMDIMSGREPVDKGQETVITLERGSVKLNNNTLISKEINGKAVLRKDRVLLEDFNFRLLDIIANRVDGELITGEDVLKLDLSLKSEPLFEKDRALFDEADINFKGPVDNLSIYGKVERRESPDILLNIYLISDNKVLNIGSKIRLDGEEMSLSMDTEIDRSTDIFSSVIMPSEGRIKINGDYTEWPLVKADIVNKHLKLNGYDFSDIIHVKTKVLFENDVFSKMVVDIDTESSVFNFYPIDETEASIWIEGEVARLLYVKIGDTISASGTLGLKPPRELFLKINFGDFDIKRILTILGEGSDAEESVSGLLSGEILIKGPIGNLYTRLGLEAVNGYLGTIKYEKMLINAKA